MDVELWLVMVYSLCIRKTTSVISWQRGGKSFFSMTLSWKFEIDKETSMLFEKRSVK